MIYIYIYIGKKELKRVFKERVLVQPIIPSTHLINWDRSSPFGDKNEKNMKTRSIINVHFTNLTS
jgi:hypothetical protein